MSGETNEGYEDLHTYRNQKLRSNAPRLEPRQNIRDQQTSNNQADIVKEISNAHFRCLLMTTILTAAMLLIAMIIIGVYFGTKFSSTQTKACPNESLDTGCSDIVWSDWGVCSVPCGASGTQQRTAPCPGYSTTETCTRTETRTCNNGPCKTCSKAYALINGDVYNIGSAALTVSTYNRTHGTYHGPAHSRLNDCQPDRWSCAWVSSYGRTGDWIQADFGRVFRITKIATQGRADTGPQPFLQWTTSYKVGFSTDGKNFQYTEELPGNTDSATIVENAIAGDHVASYVRILVMGYSNLPAISWEVYGCPAELNAPW